MKRPINIPCIYVENWEEIETAEKLGLEKPKEQLIVIWTVMLEVSHIQPNLKPKEEDTVTTNCWITSGSRTLASPMGVEEVLILMRQNNWII